MKTMSSENPVAEKVFGYARLLESARTLPPIRTAVVHPVDGPSIQGAVAAARASLIVPVLVGSEQKI
jgi:hypothetical protein